MCVCVCVCVSVCVCVALCCVEEPLNIYYIRIYDAISIKVIVFVVCTHVRKV